MENQTPAPASTDSGMSPQTPDFTTQPATSAGVSSSAVSQAPIYPMPAGGISAPTPLPSAPSPLNAASLKLLNQKSAPNALALALSGASLGVVVLLIFAPKLISSVSMVAVWLLIVAGLSGAGLYLAIKAYSTSDSTDVRTTCALVLSMIMLVNCIIFGSYYIKLEIELHNLRKRYSSTSSSIY